MSTDTERTGTHADVLIVGGGVAGSSLAAVLARAGLGVVVVEREQRFRDRVRGEAIHPWGMREVDRLGLRPVLEAAGGNPLPHWQSYAGRVPQEPFSWAERTPDGHTELGVYHPAHQQALLDHAAASGARVLRPAKVVGFRHGAQPEVDVTTEDTTGATGTTTIRARLVVGADGRTSAVRRWIGAETLTDPPHHTVSGGLLDGVTLDPSSTHEASPPGMMALVFPQAGGRVRAYLMWGDHRASAARATGEGWFGRALAELYPEGAFATARPAGPAASFANSDIWPDRVAGERVVLVGDAAGANDPSMGHGLSLVFRDVRELRDLLLSERDWQRAIVAFAERRAAYYGVLRHYARWRGILGFEEGPEADARRGRFSQVRTTDPELGGFGRIVTHGPNGLVADASARHLFLGDDR